MRVVFYKIAEDRHELAFLKLLSYQKRLKVSVENKSL
jgi:hypothetical protein